MPRAFRVFVLPLLLAAPMVLASWAPARFFADPRCAAFFALMAVGLAIENWLVDAGSVSSALGKRFDRRTYELAALTNIACYYAPVWEYFHGPEVLPRGTLWAALGLGLMLIGEGLRIGAIRTLGRFFTMRVTVVAGHRVVRDGLYRYVRHPAYSGWFLLSLGVGIFFGSLIGVLGTSLFVVVLGLRVRVEETALESELGDEYRRYREEVRSRFLPGVF
jgi:protein-S-isoprenylcysteine O-methyltransferase Ste14